MTENIQEESRILTAVEQRAVELKYEGYTYAEMETLLKEQFPDSFPAKKTLEGWFYKNGRLFDIYNSYQKEQSEISRKEGQDLWNNHAKNAIRAVLTIMKNPDANVRLRAAQEVLGRVYGAIPKIVYQPESKDVLDELLTKIGLLDDNGKPHKDL